MVLTKFAFQITGLDTVSLNSFEIEALDLGQLNLLVGKNACGKTTVIDYVGYLAVMLNGSSANYIGKWQVSWQDEETKTIYEYRFDKKFPLTGIFIEEYFTENGKMLFERKNDKGKIFSYGWKNDYEDINPPMDKHILNIRRDEKEYPYLEKIAKWAEGVHSFKFGHIHAPTFMPGALDKRSLPSIKDKDFNKILGDLNEPIKNKIIEDFNQLGYNVQLLEVKKEGEQNVLFVKENDLKFQIRYSQLSQGMFRSLSLLIFIHYLIEKEHSQLIIIDDLCEGLDYDRATRLGKILFGRMKEKGIQFIATSNDSFLMNVVDIEYWNVIQREGHAIKSFNYKNSQSKFEEFKTTGLNNFDLFASNFLA